LYAKGIEMKTYDDCIIFLLAKAYQKAHGDFKKRLQSYGLTPIQHLILEVLWGEDGLSASDIGKKLVLDGATLSGVLDRLTAGGWILKESDTEDKRVLRNYLTPRSKKLKPKLAETRNQTNEDLLKTFSLEEKVLLKRFLRDMQ
jgi:DNA-binding MarR family transcriptional regulator